MDQALCYLQKKEMKVMQSLDIFLFWKINQETLGNRARLW